MLNRSRQCFEFSRAIIFGGECSSNLAVRGVVCLAFSALLISLRLFIRLKVMCLLTFVLLVNLVCALLIQF